MHKQVSTYVRFQNKYSNSKNSKNKNSQHVYKMKTWEKSCESHITHQTILIITVKYVPTTKPILKFIPICHKTVKYMMS